MKILLIIILTVVITLAVYKMYIDCIKEPETYDMSVEEAEELNKLCQYVRTLIESDYSFEEIMAYIEDFKNTHNIKNK